MESEYAGDILPERYWTANRSVAEIMNQQPEGTATQVIDDNDRMVIGENAMPDVTEGLNTTATRENVLQSEFYYSLGDRFIMQPSIT